MKNRWLLIRYADSYEPSIDTYENEPDARAAWEEHKKDILDFRSSRESYFCKVIDEAGENLVDK